MELIFDTDTLFDATEIELIKIVLNCADEQELQIAIEGISRAAIYEYFEMILGKQIPTRANEFQERRLFQLLKNYFVGRIPSEAEVSSIFQLTESNSRALLRNVKTKYKFNLEQELLTTMKLTLLTSVIVGGNYRVVISSESILEELRQTVSLRAAHLDQISKVKNSAGVYNIPEDTFAVLCQHYDVNIADILAAAARG